MTDSERPMPESSASEGPLPNRFNRGTLLGCAGLLSVLGMPALLFLPIEQWSPPLWLALLVPLAAFALAALGAWLLSRVPASAPIHSRDPEHPLTTTGLPPLMERPAGRANQVALWAIVGLVLLAASGYVLTSSSHMVQSDVERGIMLSGIAGVALIADGLLIAGRRLPVPALRWVRVPVQSAFSRQGAPAVLLGLVWLAWALWVALGVGLPTGAVGLALLTLLAVAAAPLGRRVPPRWRTASSARDGDRLPIHDNPDDHR
jgi:hypothetical protein